MPSNPRASVASVSILLTALMLAGCAAAATPDVIETSAPSFITDDRIADDALAILGVYEVDGTDVVAEIDPAYEAVWTRFTELVDVTQWPQITLFVALDRDASPGGTEGAVGPLATDPSLYYVALDVTGVEPAAELDSTMIHEFGHLVTLNPGQIPLDIGGADTCEVITYNDRCPPEGSYLRAWLDEFWPGYVDSEADSEGDTAAADRFATGDFVTEYAAKNPLEDVAETFDAWVREKSEPAGSGVVDDKLRFFDSYPEIVELKQHAQAALAG
ncbi:MAG: hypothetical protein KF761_12035 [Salinibacterium sp.]|nr:hypothetical protein [Salinibacterium sp.]